MTLPATVTRRTVLAGLGVIARGGRPPSPQEAGLKDTVLIGPGGKVGPRMRFADYSGAALPCMYRRHTLEHEDAGMMGQFTVV